MLVYMAIHISEDHTQLADLLNKHNIGILATSDNQSTPHAATIYFFTDPDFNIYFMTREGTTKQKNLDQNPKAALAIFEAATQKTVQISGTVTKIEDPNLRDGINSKVHAITHDTSYKESPPFTKLSSGNNVAYCLHPNKLRLAEYVKTQQQIDDGVGIFDMVVIPPNA